MKTKYDIGEEVFVKGTVEGIFADKDGVRYRVELNIDNDFANFVMPTLKEDDLERRVQQ